MSSIILEGNQTISIKINEKVYKSFPNQKNYNKNLMSFDSKNNIVIKKDFINKTVPNIIRYKIKIFNNGEKIQVKSILNKKNNIKNSNYNDILLNKDTRIDKSIVLILESPHKAEFKYNSNDLNPISPAQGSTGKNINNKIKLLLKEVINKDYCDLKNGNYKLVIINPVSFQTSLHFFHRKALSKYHFKKFRDRIWQQSWEKDIIYAKTLKDNLIQINSDLIINACTSNLSPLIQDFLTNNFNKTILQIYHPSAWIFNGFGLN